MDKQQVIKEFEYMRDMAELKALSNLSLEQPPTQEQYEKMISLAKKLNLVSEDWTT